MERPNLRPGEKIVPVLGIQRTDGTIEIPTGDGSLRAPTNGSEGTSEEGGRVTHVSSEFIVMNPDQLKRFLATHNSGNSGSEALPRRQSPTPSINAPNLNPPGGWGKW